MNELAEIKQNYKAAKQTRNDIKIKGIENEMRECLKNYIGKNIKGWIGEVLAVSDILGSTWVTVKWEHVEFKLWPEGDILGNKPLDIFGKLNKGDLVVFDGVIRKEMSFTISGAIDEPAIQIRPERVVRYY